MFDTSQTSPIADSHISAPETRPRDTVEARLEYVVPGNEKPRVVAARYLDPAGRNFSTESRQVRIENGRLAPAASLEREGFALIGHDSAAHSFSDDAEIERLYYPEMAKLIRKETGATRVHVFDHTLRRDTGAARNGGARKWAVRRVHNDYTEASAPRRLNDLLGPEAVSARRFAIINVWRPIKGPVETAPLALLDAGTLAPNDLVAADLIYPDRNGEIYYATWNPRHRWVYYPRMEPDETILIKGYDSLEDGQARLAPHTAFDDPETQAAAAPRESIEVRALVLFD